MAYDDFQDALDGISNYYFLEMKDEIADSWGQYTEAMNDGQFSLEVDYMVDAIVGWEAQAQETWPWGVSSGDYEAACFEAFDFDVLVRAFSEAISGPSVAIDRCIDNAQVAAVMSLVIDIIDTVIEILSIL